MGSPPYMAIPSSSNEFSLLFTDLRIVYNLISAYNGHLNAEQILIEKSRVNPELPFFRPPKKRDLRKTVKDVNMFLVAT